MEPPEADEAAVGKFRHIKKKALKNKSLSVSFNEKDLRDYVTGFHKRKKKRRKEAQRQLEEVKRRKRIEARKKRKLEREYVLSGGVLPATDAEGDAEGEFLDDGEEAKPQPSVSVYDHEDLKVTVTTSEISREDENDADVAGRSAGKSSGTDELRGVVTGSKKKPFKRVARQKSFNKSSKKNSKDRKRPKRSR
ncbi:hypothetical protein MLD38_027520 [Melastoma candidum]|uniref:Uncharacterized protein n=1 Tax=Melastoma candidum TaxID=119954 RepID=A0ACB9P4Q2_9MYRT|nr:hypothetical protein MLD38_027520 [Melastoma candidum]